MKIEVIEKLSSNKEQVKAAYLDLFVSVPYIVELKEFKVVNNINECLLMGRLEQLFIQFPDGFCKCKRSCKLQDSLDGRSWQEELGMNRGQLDRAFRAISVHYESKREFLQQKEKFKGKYYCCYTDVRADNRTYYFRNHELVDDVLGKLLTERSSKVSFLLKSYQAKLQSI